MAVVSDEVKDIVEMIARGYSRLLPHVTATPGSDTLEFIEFIEDIDDLNDSDLIDMLASWAGLSYDDFKRIWDDLLDSEKNEVLDAVVYRMAVAGFEELLRRIATASYVRKNWDVRKKIIDMAKKYVRGKIDLDDLSEGIVDVLWGTEKDTELGKRYIWDFWSGITLNNYIDEETVKELVRKYLIEELEAPWI